LPIRPFLPCLLPIAVYGPFDLMGYFCAAKFSHPAVLSPRLFCRVFVPTCFLVPFWEEPLSPQEMWVGAVFACWFSFQEPPYLLRLHQAVEKSSPPWASPQAGLPQVVHNCRLCPPHQHADSRLLPPFFCYRTNDPPSRERPVFFEFLRLSFKLGRSCWRLRYSVFHFWLGSPHFPKALL